MNANTNKFTDQSAGFIQILNELNNFMNQIIITVINNIYKHKN